MADTERDAAIAAATRSITVYRAAQRTFTKAAHREMELNDEEPVLEARLVATLIGTDNPLTSTPEKPKQHSASSAAEAIKTHPEYLEHRRNLRDVVLRKNEAHADATAARLNAMVAVTTMATADLEDMADV